MMDCKKALGTPEVDGNLEKAMDWYFIQPANIRNQLTSGAIYTNSCWIYHRLRAKGIAKARSNADRPALEGLIALVFRGAKATLIEVNSETGILRRSFSLLGSLVKNFVACFPADFVARNADFQSLVERVALTANKRFDVGTVPIERLMESPGDDAASPRPISEFLTDAVTTIRENIVRNPSLL
jgi:translation elongation factor EF-Ts